MSERLVAGLAAILFYAAHVGYWVRERKPENALWACHIGCLMVGVGWLAAWPLVNAIGLVWLVPGVLLWLYYLATNGTFRWTSLLTHVGGSLLGIWGGAKLGFPSNVWWKAGLGFVALVLISGRVSRASENVNFSVKVWSGSESVFPSYPRYISGLVLIAFAVFFFLERLLRHLPQIT